MRLPATSRGYEAALQRAAMIRADRGLVVVSGADRASYLQGLLTNDTVVLKPGDGCYAAYLTPQGRMISDLVVHELGDVMLLVLPRETKDTVLARLDQFVFSEDVQLGDVSATFMPLDIIGPDASQVLASVLELPVDRIAALPPHGAVRASVGGDPTIVRRISDSGISGFELLSGADHRAQIKETLRSVGVVELDDAAAEALRIEAGVPLFGRDMNEETIPLEAGIEERAISFTKGCYVGQEVIIRVLHRGHGRVARRLVGLTFDAAADAPAPATVLLVDGREVGNITSSVFSPALERPIALAYLKRDFAAPGIRVATAAGDSGEVVALPFVAR